MEIVLFQGEPYRIGNVFLNSVIQNAIIVDNPVAFLSYDTNVSNLFLEDRPDAALTNNASWEPLLYAPLFANPARNTREFILNLGDSIAYSANEFYRKLGAFRFQAENTTYERTLSIIQTEGFDGDPAINATILNGYKSSKVTIVRDEKAYIIICPKTLASWFFNAFEERHRKLVKEMIASVHSGVTTTAIFSKIDVEQSALTYLSKFSDVEVINFKPAEGDTVSSVLRRFALFLQEGANTDNREYFVLTICCLFIPFFFFLYKTNGNSRVFRYTI